MRFPHLIALIALAVQVAAVPTLPAQADSTGSVEGTVVDAEGRGVANALVSVVGTAIGVVADANGNYSVRGLPAGVYAVYARYLGYQATTSRELVVAAGQALRHDITLRSYGPITTAPVPGESAAGPELEVRAHFAARAAQLDWPVLRTSPPHPSTRELRIETFGGMVYGPRRVFRLVVQPDRISGEIIEVWWHSATADGPYQVRTGTASTCSVVDTVTTICRVATHAIDWRAVADSVERIGVWEAFTDVGVRHENINVTDEMSVLAEAFIDGEYRSVWYYGPKQFPGAQTTALLAVERLFDQLTARAEGADRVR